MFTEGWKGMRDQETYALMNLLIEKLSLDETDVQSHRVRTLGTVFFYKTKKQKTLSIIKVGVDKNLPRGRGGTRPYHSSLSGSLLGVVSQSRGPIHFPISPPGVFCIQ